MISKITAVLSALTAIVITVGSFALPTFANEDISQTVSSILEYRFGGHDSETLQKAADTELPKGAGTDSEWYAMSLSQYCDIDLSAYSEALEKYLSENEIASATSREKYALSLIAAGKDSPYITDDLYDEGSDYNDSGENLLIYGLAVHPVYRHQGIARSLMSAFIEAARQAGKTHISLTCKESLITFYESLGYTNHGVSESVKGNVTSYDMEMYL